MRHRGSRRFGGVEPPQTLLTLPCRPTFPYITVVRGGSVQWNLPELTPNCPSGQLPPSSQWFEGVRCGRTAPSSLEPSCRPASPFVTVVEGASVGSNRPKRTPTFLVGLLPPSSQRFEEVRCSRTSPNSLDPFLYACSPLRHSGLRRFGEVEPPQTHSTLPCRPASPYSTVVRGGSVQLNLPELTPNCPSGQLPPSSQWFEWVRCGRTAPNSLEPSL